MTREAELLIDMWDILHRECHKVVTEENYDVIKKAIKALERESMLDKARAEIESQRKEVSKKHSENDELQAFYNGLNDGLKDARDIIDEYKAESEVTK